MEQKHQNRSVVVVDDDPIFLFLTSELLKIYGAYAPILTAQSATEALELIQQHNPDMVILDLHMPGTDGFAFLDKVAAEGNVRASYVVLSSSLMEEDKAKAYSYPFVKHFLTKPLSEEDIRILSQ